MSLGARETDQHISCQPGSGSGTNPQHNLATTRNVDDELADGVKHELEGLQQGHDVLQGDGKVDVEIDRDRVRRAHVYRGADGGETAGNGLDEGELFGYVWEREQNVPATRTSPVAIAIVPLRMGAEDGKRGKVVRGPGLGQISKGAGIELDFAGSDPVMDDKGLEGVV